MAARPQHLRHLPALTCILAFSIPAPAQFEAVPREPTAEQSVRWGPLEFRYELEPGPLDRIRLRASVINTSAGPVEIELPWCLAWLRLQRDGRPLWDRGVKESCGAMHRFVTLEPGGSEVERYVLRLYEIRQWLQDGEVLQVSAYLPGHRTPRLPPRAVVEVPLSRVVIRSTKREVPPFARTLCVPGLEWGASAKAVTAKFVREGFQSLGAGANGSLLFNGHDFLGLNAGIIARMHAGRLVKLVALMEPNRPGRSIEEFREVRRRLEPYYGGPASSGSGSSPRVLWRKPAVSGFYHAGLRITSEGVIRLDLETPEWARIHGSIVSRSEEPDGRG